MKFEIEESGIATVLAVEDRQTLLQKALAAGGDRRMAAKRDTNLQENIDLLKAYIDGRITGRAVATATGIRKEAISGWIGSVTLKGLRAGLIQFKD